MHTTDAVNVREFGFIARGLGIRLTATRVILKHNVQRTRAYYVGGKEGNCLHMEVGGEFTRGGDFTKIILMRATVVRPKSGENK